MLDELEKNLLTELADLEAQSKLIRLMSRKGSSVAITRSRRRGRIKLSLRSKRGSVPDAVFNLLRN